MNKEEFKQKWQEDELELVRRDLDDSWRHGNNVTEVFLEQETGKYYQVKYRESGDGYHNGIQEDEFELCEVFPHKKMIEVIEYTSQERID